MTNSNDATEIAVDPVIPRTNPGSLHHTNSSQNLHGKNQVHPSTEEKVQNESMDSDEWQDNDDAPMT